MGLFKKIGLGSKDKKTPEAAAGGGSPKVVILGIDGVPYTLLTRYIDEGVTPNLGRIAQAGSLRQMDVVWPEVSSVSWSSFITGVNPAKHGIFGFMDLKPSSYDMVFPNFKDNKALTFWDVLGSHGKRSAVINIPDTYPARKTEGVLVAGFVALDLEKAVYPPGIFPPLKNLGYELDVNANKAREDMPGFVEDVFRVLDRRIAAFEMFWERESWDLFIATITGTDRLHHFLWDAVDDTSHAFHQKFRDYYRKVDEYAGKLYDRLGPEDLFILCSDHGFTLIKQEVYLNRWLEEQGYLKFESSGGPKSLKQIHPSTRAFALDPSRIYINLKGRYPNGSVSPGEEYETLRNEIADKLKSLTCDGESVISAVHKKEDIYNGPLMDQSHDLVAVCQHGYDIKGSLKSESVFGRTHFTGMHTFDDATFYINRKDLPDRRPNIIDIAPTVLQGLGVCVPEEYDGRSLLED